MPESARADIQPGHRRLVHIGVGEGGLFLEPAEVRTVLGSCVAVTLHSPEKRIGGMFHALLPSWKDFEDAPPPPPCFRYVDTAVEHLVDALRNQGVEPRRLTAKVYGGTNALFDAKISVAGRNIKVALDSLSRLGIRVAASSVGGSKSRKLFFNTDTGEVVQHMLGA